MREGQWSGERTGNVSGSVVRVTWQPDFGTVLLTGRRRGRVGGWGRRVEMVLRHAKTGLETPTSSCTLD